MDVMETSFITTGDGVRIAYRFDGPSELPVLLLSNSIGTDLHMWDAEVPALSEHFRVLRYDGRGHGDSGVPTGAYSVDRLGRDVLELLDALGLRRVHLLGLSLGGFVGQWLGIHAPERVDRLVLANTAAHVGPPEYFDGAIAELLAAPDMDATAETFLRNWFPAQMLETDNPAVEAFRRTLRATKREGVAGSWAAVRDADLRRTISLIGSPTLVIAGEHDTVTSAEHGKEIAAGIPGARLRVLPAVHLSNVEQHEAFLDAVVTFLKEPA
ncbi:3-oxoadipate enol-lactonase [Pseudonocardia eucalypti]|uniref:3-oxoadipate enol-lactonase n=2 Tax=Pseudonocardia eucalypti TaxID=648755 RepID=A0ABP9RBH6_9PSEU